MSTFFASVLETSATSGIGNAVLVPCGFTLAGDKIINATVILSTAGSPVGQDVTASFGAFCPTDGYVAQIGGSGSLAYSTILVSFSRG